MNQTAYWCLFVLFMFYNIVFGGRRIFSYDNENQLNQFEKTNDDDEFLMDTGKVLKRDKRYLLWTNGGISKVILRNSEFEQDQIPVHME